MADNSTHDSTDSAVSRRRILRAGGATGVVGLTGLAGCTGDGDGGDAGSGGGTGGDGTGGNSTGEGTTTNDAIGTVRIGVVDPLSGPFAALGQGNANGVEVGVSHVNDGVIGDFDFEMEMVGPLATETEPAAGTQKAQRLVEQDEVDFLAGGISSSVSIAISEYANNASVCYMSTSGSAAITGEECQPYTFREVANAYQTSFGMVRMLDQEDLGTSVWVHIADYAYGQSIEENVRNRVDQTDGVEVVGSSAAQLGETNFGSYISQISNSEADAVILGNTGGDMINFVGQAADQGLTAEKNILAGTLGLPPVYQALGAAADGTYFTERYPKQMDIGDNRQFVEDYQSMHDGELPSAFSYGGYSAPRYFANAIQRAGTADADAVAEELPGTVDSVLGEVELRDCDHQAVMPLWAAKHEVPEDGEVSEVQILSELDREEIVPSCEETGCTF